MSLTCPDANTFSLLLIYLLCRRDTMRISLVRLCEDELVADDTYTYAKDVKSSHSKYPTGKTLQRQAYK
jgi:hypothetical protein